MKTEHTAGPWRVDGRDLFQGVGHDKALMHAVIRDPSERWTALVEIEDEEGEANARLIAAAPELLAALEALYAQEDWTRDGDVIDPRSPLGLARAAIAKAKATP